MKFQSMLFSIGLALGAALAGAAAAQPAAPAPASHAGDHLISMTNSGGTVVSAVYVAPSGSPDFSDDLLGKQVASVGKTVKVKVKDPSGACVFDVQFLMADGATVTRKGVNVCESDRYTFTR